MPHAPQALAGLGLAAAAAAAAGCATTGPSHNEPIVEIGFGAGVRVPVREADAEAPLVSGAVALGAMRWQARGEAGPARHYLGMGLVFIAESFDFERTDVGVDLVLAPPRSFLRTGIQFRLGPRLAWTHEHAGVAFSTEWSDFWLGGLFAEAQYDFIGEEAAFLFGARVNLLFPVTYVRATMTPLD